MINRAAPQQGYGGPGGAQGGYPMQGGMMPPQQPQYGYPPMQGAPGGFPGYPPQQQQGFPPQQQGYPPQQGFPQQGYPPQQQGYPPQQQGFNQFGGFK